MSSPLRKAAFLLPSAFTLASLFCGFYAISRAFGGEHDPRGLQAGALAILFGAFFDAFDGRVARLTRTETEIGLELDSLADIITFGVAPATLAYHWGLDGLGFGGLVVAFAWIAAGAYRLARFNVLARRAKQRHSVQQVQARAQVQGKARQRPGKYIRGLPIPPAAALLVSLLLAAQQTAGSARLAAQGSLVFFVLSLSFLMVSPFRFRSFKAVTWRSRRTVATVVLVLLAAAVVAVRLPDAYVFVFLLALYIGLGLAETVLHRTLGVDPDAPGSGSVPSSRHDV